MMLKNLFLSAAITGLVAAVAMPIQVAPAAAQMSCREAAKAQHPDDMLARLAYLRECRAAWKSSQATEEVPAEPTYAGDL